MQEGAYLTLYAEGDVLAYARLLGDDAIITVLNRGNETSLELPLWKLDLINGRLHDLLENDTLEVLAGKVTAVIPARSARLLSR